MKRPTFPLTYDHNKAFISKYTHVYIHTYMYIRLVVNKSTCVCGKLYLILQLFELFVVNFHLLRSLVRATVCHFVPSLALLYFHLPSGATFFITTFIIYFSVFEFVFIFVDTLHFHVAGVCSIIAKLHFETHLAVIALVAFDMICF